MPKFIDMTGWKMWEHGVSDSRWTVIQYIGKSKWLCKCNCEKQTQKIIESSTLRSGTSKSCGCYNSEVAAQRQFIDMTGWVMKEHGVERSRLTVLNQAGYTNDRHALWRCQCECGNIITTVGDLIRNGNTLSCGCLHKEIVTQNGKKNSKQNNYDIESFDYGIGWAKNSGIEFQFDLQDYTLLQNHCWSTCIDHNGYTRLETQIKINGKYKRVSMAEFLTGEKDIDHADQNPMNNKRSNFRKATRSQQTSNQGLKSNNTSGITGVYWSKQECMWKAEITSNKKRIHLGTFVNKNDAILARLKAEVKYFGEFAPQKYLYDEYGIKVDKENTNEL